MTSKFPLMLPSEKQFKDQMKQMKIKLSDRVIFYCHEGNIWAARAYWMFKAFGHKKVQVLNGGMDKWKAEKRETV